MITGFPNETEEDHLDTLKLMDYVKYDFGFMFKYSERPGTLAAKKFNDNVPEDVKQRRLSEIIDLQLKHSYHNLFNYRGKTVSVLIEKESKKSSKHWCGRNPQNLMVVFPKNKLKLVEKTATKDKTKAMSKTKIIAAGTIAFCPKSNKTKGSPI